MIRAPGGTLGPVPRLASAFLLAFVFPAPSSPPAAPTPGFDFSDESYRALGIDAERIRGRLSEEGGFAVIDRSPDASRRGLRALEWRAAYDAAGCPIFFHRFGSLGADAFASDAAGSRSRLVADEFQVYTFPSRQAAARPPATRERQDPVFDTSPGDLGRNPLGLWRVRAVAFAEAVFRSRAGLAALEEIRRRNGTDRDGTPILKHPSEIRMLERAGYVRLTSPGEPAGAPWVLWPLDVPPPGRRIPADAFLSLATVDEGLAVDPMLEQTFLCLAAAGQYGMPRMPLLPPFIEELPIPPILEPRARVDPAPEGAALQGFADAPPAVFFDVHERPFLHRFHPDLPPSLLWGYNGRFPGPTIRVRRGQPFLLRVWNDLPASGSGGLGQPRTVCRPELFPLASESAGFPEDHYPPGQFKDHYCSALLGSPESVPGPVTGHYRDGRLGFSAQNLYRGLAGFMIAQDAADSGDETDPDPRALRLPGGAFDVPLLLAEKGFDETLDHALTRDAFTMAACRGELATVNGSVQPYFRVARRKYRFRLWNAGPSRAYDLVLSGGLPFILLASDGFLLESPQPLQGLPLPADEGRDVVIDFSGVKLGSAVYLEDRAAPIPGGSRPAPGVPASPVRILKFLVDHDTPDSSRIPPRLRRHSEEPVPPDLPVRSFTFSDVRGLWAVNGKGFDLDRADAVVKPGSREIWILKNASADVAHSIRLPAEALLLASPREAFRPGADLGPGGDVKLLVRFPEWPGRYVMWCGDSVREDRGMIFRWDVRP